MHAAHRHDLTHVRVLVAGAGFAGLAAARALEARGAVVTVVDARDRVGGRVWTVRDGFLHGQHAEAGADFIESNQVALLALVHDLKLRTAPILRRGFGYYGTDDRGRLRVQSLAAGLRAMAKPLDRLIRDYEISERRWDSAIARDMAGRSVAAWLRNVGAATSVTRRFRGLRGLFLADPDDLSLLALVDFFADIGASGWGDSFRIVGGNDRIATSLARQLHGPVHLQSVLRRVRQDRRHVVATLDGRSGLAQLTAEYLVVALPATTARAVSFTPGLPDLQRDAVSRLRYGSATRLLVQFAGRFWIRRGQPNAFGSDQPFGALWDGNEQQKGRAGILSFLAGGGASRELRDLLRSDRLDGVLARIGWLGRPTPVLASRAIVWEDDVWAKGGYAFFDPGFDPTWRDWLARPFGRVVFAGEHTSIRWQGYMNGAVESGLRAAAEVAAMAKVSVR